MPTMQEEFVALGEQLAQVNAELTQLEERAEILAEQKQQIIGIRSYLANKAQQSQAIQAQQEAAAAVAEATADIDEPEDETPDAVNDYDDLAPNAGSLPEDD